MSTFESIVPARVSRRSLLRGGALGAGGVLAAALIGCGSDDEEENPAPASTSESTGTTTATTDEVAAEFERQRALAAEWGAAHPFQFPEPAKEPKAGGVMRWSTNWDISIFDPTRTQAGGTMGPTNVVYNRLLGYKRGVDADPFKTELEPELAASWEVSPDGLTYTFALAPDIRWHNVAPLDGRAFTAADVKAAYEVYAADGVATNYFISVDTMETPDDATLVVKLKSPEPDFIAALGTRYLTIFPPELVADGTLESRMVGTGPMILKEARASERIVFEKNPDYFEREVLLDGMEALIQPDLAARLAGFRADQTDYAYSVVSGKRDVEALLSTNPQVQVNASSPIAYTSTFALQLRDPKWQDERVRRAVNLALDREQEISIVYGGEGIYLPMVPWFWTFDERPSGEEALGNWWRYDPEEAQALLKAAGAENLQFDYQYFTYSARNTQTAEVYESMLAPLGIKMSSQALDYTSYNSQWVGGTFPDTSFGWVPFGFSPNTPYYEHVHSTSPSNRWGINDPELDGWAEQQRVELDPTTRREIHRKMWDKYQDQIYYISQPWAPTYDVYQPWLRGFRVGGALGVSTAFYDIGDLVGEMWLDR